MFGEYFMAHRLAYLLHNERLPSDLFVCHSCDVRNCVNPTHLFLGTNEDNLKDMAAKNRGRGPSKVTESDVKRIRELLATGATQQAVGDLFGLHQECSDNIDDVEKEIGDCLWYVANVAEDIDTLFSEVLNRRTFEVCVDRWDIDEALLELPVCAGVIAENVKKAIRDNDGEVSHARGANILKALRVLVTWLARLCSWYGVTLEECAQLNLDKLRSRAEWGVLKGDGDSR